MARGYIAHEMDWVTMVLALLGGGSLATVVSIFVFRHQAKRDKWADIQQSYEKQIDSAEKRGDPKKAKQVRQEYEGQLEAWRAQQSVESLAPRSISADIPTTLTAAELERLRVLLAESQGLNPGGVSAEGHFLRGNAHYDSGDLRQAVDSYTVALRLRPEFQEAFYNRGVAYSHLGEHQKAIADYTEALRLRPDYPEAYNNRGVAYINLGEHQKAIADFTEALHLRPDYPAAYSNRGVAYRYLGELQKALADYTEALRLRPDLPGAYFNLACLHSLQQNIEACMTYLEQAVEMDESLKGKGRTDPDLAWARQDERVRKLLDITSVIQGADDKELRDLWDNDADATYDRL